MIHLPNNAAAAIAPPQTAPILLLELTFTSPSSRTLYLCSRPFGTGNTYAGHVYDPLILDWSPVAFGQIDPVSLETQPGDTSVRILNTEPVGGYDTFSGFLDAFDWAYASATLSQVHEDALADGDAVTLFSGAVEMPEALSRESVTIRISGRELSLKDKWPVTLVNATDYPGADPDDIGAMIPQVWGACKRVPARAVAAGGKTTITQDMTDSSPGDGGTLAVTDGSLLPSGAFTLQVEMEQISIASRSGNTLTLASSGARGYNGTTAVDHDTGAHCAEVKTHYVYMVADHPVKSIDAVYVDDVRQAITSGSDSNCRVYTGQSGDEMTGYPGKAVIDFQALPYVKKQVNVEINNTLGIDHTDGISDGITVSDNIDVSASQAVKVWNFETYTINSGSVDTPQYMYDGDLDVTRCRISSTDGDVDISKAFYEEASGPPQQFRICICCGGGSKPGSFETRGGYLVLRFNGKALYLTSSNAGQTVKSSWYDTSISWATMNARVMEVFAYQGSYPYDVAIMQVWVEIRYTPSISKSGSAYRSGSLSGTGTASLTGDVTGGGNSTADVVIGRAVCADVRGYQDDSSGTYTGAANALIERPDHVFHHMLKAVLGETHIDIEDGLIGFWPMDEGAGTTVHDGRGPNHGTINGTVAWEDGQVGKCLHFDGSSGYVDFGDVSAFDFTTNDNFAISFLMYADDTPTDTEFIIGKFNWPDRCGWGIFWSDAARLRFVTLSPDWHDSYSNVISTGVWHHIVINYSAGVVTFYVDGVDSTYSQGSHQLDAATGCPLIFGKYGSSYFFDGKLDEARIYNKNVLPSDVFGDPQITVQPDFLKMDGTVLTEGTIGSLVDHQWDYGDNDSLGFNTVYIADASGNPNITNVNISSIMVPTAPPVVSGGNFLIGASDGFVYTLDSSAYKDSDNYQILPIFRSSYMTIPFGYANFTQFHLIADSAAGADVTVKIYKDYVENRSDVDTDLAMGASNDILVDDAMMLVNEATFSLTVAPTELFKNVNFNARAVMVGLEDFSLSTNGVNISGILMKYRRLSR